MNKIETDKDYEHFLYRFAAWNRNSGEFDVQWNDIVVRNNTKITITGKREPEISLEFVLHELAAMTFGEYMDRINDELQKAVRKQYIDSFKL